jgi:uncharacterized protein with von Willebrand factor type A (vWA) domain
MTKQSFMKKPVKSKKSVDLPTEAEVLPQVPPELLRTPMKAKKTRVKKVKIVEPVAEVLPISEDSSEGETVQVEKPKAKRGKAVKDPSKPPRKLSTYNEYVKLKMMDTEIRLLPSKERFAAISRSYKYDKEHGKLPVKSA